MEYDTKNPHITKTDTHFFMPFGPLKMSEGSQSFEHDFQDAYTIYNNVLAHAVLIQSVLSDSSDCYYEISFKIFLPLHQFSFFAWNEETFKR